MVDGDLTMQNLAFFGLIIVSGNVDARGGGSSLFNVEGALIAGGDLTLSGSFGAKLDRDRIDRYLNAIRTMLITYREIRK